MLIHSPLTGLLTWAYVANVLWARDIDVVVPGLHLTPDSDEPYWKQHVDSIVASLEDLDEDDSVVLVAYSGAGVLLPLVAAALTRRVDACIFVDAALPRDGASRLDLFASEDARDLFRALAQDGMIPPFPDAVLRKAIPDDAVRGEFAAELRALPLGAYEEPIPLPPDWPGVPCAFLGFRESAASYTAAIEEATRNGWPFSQLRGGHFEILNDPERVAAELVQLARASGVDIEG